MTCFSCIAWRSAACVFAPTCGTAPALEHSGDLYACDHFVEPAYRLGNIVAHEKGEGPSLGEMVASERQRRFGLEKREGLPAYCRGCEVRFACHGGCPRNRFAQTADGEDGLNYLCPSYTAFFEHIDPAMRRMCELLKQDRAPSEVVKLGIPGPEA